MVKTAWIVGCGPSLMSEAIPDSGLVIACNRAIEVVPADVWIWVDRMHHDRSSWHPNARRADRHGPEEFASIYRPDTRVYRPTRRLPAEEGELYLRGGTLVPAAHLAIRLGAEEVVFAACDGWSPERKHSYGWDARVLSAEQRIGHQLHLEETARGVSDLAELHPKIRFSDATPGIRYLRLPSWKGKADGQEKVRVAVAR